MSMHSVKLWNAGKSTFTGRLGLMEGKQKRKSVFVRIKGLSLFKEYYNMHEHALTLFLLSLFVHIWIGVEWVYTQLATQHVFGFGEEIIGFVLGGMMAAEVLLYFPAGYIMDKIGKKYMILSGFLLLFGASYYAFLSQSAGMFVLMLFSTCYWLGKAAIRTYPRLFSATNH